jgi:hypothetical protein
VYARAEAVSVTVEKSLAPVRLTSLLSVAGVLVAAAVLMARERRRELRLLAVRGVHPARIALGTTPTVLVVAAPAAALGFGLAWLVVTQFGPASLLERHAMSSGVVAAAACLVVGLVMVVCTVALVADRSVDRHAHRGSTRWLLPLAGLGSVALTLWSFQRLDSRGGIRTFGVEARGGDDHRPRRVRAATGGGCGPTVRCMVATSPTPWLAARGHGSRADCGHNCRCLAGIGLADHCDCAV